MGGYLRASLVFEQDQQPSHRTLSPPRSHANAPRTPPQTPRAKRQDPAYVPVPPDEKNARRVQRIMAFALPALCDAVGTTLMNVGLFFT